MEDVSGFVTWFTAGGGAFHPSAEICRNNQGYYLRVKRDAAPILPGEILVHCPRELTFSFINARQSNVFRTLARSLDQVVVLRFYLIEQWLLGSASFWAPYIGILTQPNAKHGLNPPLWEDPRDLAWLEGTNLGKAIPARRLVWKQEYDALREQIPQQGRVEYTWELYLWAATILTSRSFRASALRDAEINAPILIPGLDILNHSPHAQVTWLFLENCAIRAEKTIEAGNEISNNYGPKSNEELLMGYGFCLEDNPYDTFNFGFNDVGKEKIQAAKEAREKTSDCGNNELPPTSSSSSFQLIRPLVLEQQWVRLEQGAPHNQATTYECSPHFLGYFSMVAENRREFLQGGCRWPNNETSLKRKDMCRNKMQVMAYMVELLETSLHAISANDSSLYQVQNERQAEAAKYRSGQLKILQVVSSQIRHQLDTHMELGPRNRLWRLKDILGIDASKLTQHFRQVMNIATNTTDATKIDVLGFSDAAFTIWLCGLCVLQPTLGFIDSPFGVELAGWLTFLNQWFSLDQTPVTLSTEDIADSLDDVDIAGSFDSAIKLAVAKYPDSLYNDSELVTSTLPWCLKVVRAESVRLPFGGFVLYMESSD